MALNEGRAHGARETLQFIPIYPWTLEIWTAFIYLDFSPSRRRWFAIELNKSVHFFAGTALAKIHFKSPSHK
jgi:hypothetical protein